MLISAGLIARNVDDVDNPLVLEIINFLNSARDNSAAKICPNCGLDLEYRDSMFIYRGRRWSISLPVCAHCYSDSSSCSLM
jgi:hypothetical protein